MVFGISKARKAILKRHIQSAVFVHVSDCRSGRDLVVRDGHVPGHKSLSLRKIMNTISITGKRGEYCIIYQVTAPTVVVSTCVSCPDDT